MTVSSDDAGRGTSWRAMIRGGLDAPYCARRELDRRIDGELEISRKRELLLLASELVTNSVVHAGADETCEILLEVAVRVDAIRVTVTDGGSASIPLPRDVAPPRSGGRGLYLVDRLSDHWGLSRDGSRRTRVWFEMARPQEATATASDMARRPAPAQAAAAPGRRRLDSRSTLVRRGG